MNDFKNTLDDTIKLINSLHLQLQQMHEYIVRLLEEKKALEKRLSNNK